MGDLAKCRRCEHYHFLSLRSGREMAECIYQGACRLNCLGKDYIPLDNLEYVEWLYDRQVDKNQKAR